ncbi:MAG: PstS family phosphate ABC transporter substrate-binding protein [candidate division WOR-3 bacterium]
MKHYIKNSVIIALCAGVLFSQKIVRVDGSSTVFPITEAVAEEFQKVYKDIKVVVGISGTGGGFKKFLRNETDINDASRPIKEIEYEIAKKNGIEFIELPIAYDGLTVVVNPSNNFCNELKVSELKKLWEPAAQDKIKMWSQIRESFPEKEIHLYGPGVDSGTYDYFTEAVVGKEGASRGDYVASEDDNVLVQGVASDPLALGFFGYAYYEQNKDKLKAVAIDPEDGRGPVYPTIENIRRGKYFPLSRPIFIYVNVKSLEREEVKKFVEFYIKNAKKLVSEVGYIPLSDEAYELVLKRFKNRVKGTLFGGEGSKGGISLEELLKREIR